MIAVLEKINAAAMIYEPILKKEKEIYSPVLHLVVYGFSNIRIALRFMNKDMWESWKDEKFFLKSYSNQFNGMIKQGILPVLKKMRNFALILQKGELLNIREYYDDPDFLNLDKLQNKKDRTFLLNPLLPEIDSLIESLSVQTSL